MQLSKIPHYTTPQNFAVCTSTAVLERIISSFIFLFDSKGHIFADIDATGFKITGASHYHTSRTKLKSEYAKLSIGAVYCLQAYNTHKMVNLVLMVYTVNITF